MQDIRKNEIGFKIHYIRDHRVMLDHDLAVLYDVSVKRLNEQVKRNSSRFPADFMFQLTNEEYELLRSQSATLKKGRGSHRKYLPYAFTDHGIAMLSDEQFKVVFDAIREIVSPILTSSRRKMGFK